MDEATAIQLLPTVPTKAIRKPDRLKYFWIGEPKWGKTTFFTGIPGMLLLAFEEGHAFVEANKIIIDKWDANLLERKRGGTWSQDDDGNTHTSAMEAMEALEQHCPYTFICVDTADMASKMCSDHACDQAGVKHPSDGGDYGKGWDILQTSPFRRFFGRLVKLGVGIACTSHVDIKEIKDKKGKVTDVRRESTLPKGIQKFIHTQSDIIVNCSFGRRRKGLRERDRIVSFDGSNEVLAGTRISGVVVPKKYIVTPPSDDDTTLPWKQWAGFFDPERGPARAAAAEEFYNTGAVVGIDDENIKTAEEPAEPAEPKPGPEPEPAAQSEEGGAGSKEEADATPTFKRVRRTPAVASR